MDDGDGLRTVVLCDFDGTVCLIDTAEYILDHHAQGDWRALESDLARGLLTLEECMSAQFDMISLSRDEMLAELDEIVMPRPGFRELVEKCMAHDVRFRITSAGMDFYIHHFLQPYGWRGMVEVVAPEVMDHGRGVRFRFPPLIFPQARNFKEDNVLMEQAVGHRVVYIGDGSSDLWAALSADMTFAVRGSALDALLKKRGREHFTFVDMQEVADTVFPDLIP